MATAFSPFVSALIALLITTNFSVTWERQKLHDHPLISIIIVSAVTGLTLPLLRRLSGRYATWAVHYLPIASSDEDDDDSHSDNLSDIISYGRYDPILPLGPRPRRHLFLVILSTLIFRTAILLHVETNSQCSYSGVEVALLPIILFTFDFMIPQRSWHIEIEDDNDMSNSAFDDMYSSLCFSKSRYLLPTFLFSLGVFMTICFPHSSSYICPISRRGIPVLGFQIVGAVLDSIIIIAVYRALADSHKDSRKSNLISAALIFSAAFIASSNFVYAVVTSQLGTVTLDSGYIWSVIQAAIMCSVLLLCLDQLIQVLRPLNLITLFLFSGTFARLVFTARKSRDIFPPHSKWAKVIGLSCLFVGFGLGMSFYKHTEIKNNFARRVPQWFYSMLGIAFVVSECFYLSAPRYVGFSPINYLLYESKISENRWSKQASTSKSLEAAVSEYHKRYKRSPPPNFDKWYAFAVERNAYVIDDYDDIENSLLPFWAIQPAEIRDSVPKQGIVDGIVEITVRQAKVNMDDLALPDADWVHETGHMIMSFSQWLPDMNIGLNTNQEPQVAVPWKMIEQLRGVGRWATSRAAAANISFSSTANPPWHNPGESATELTNQGHVQNTFSYKIAGVYNDVIGPACPPGSLALKSRLWDHGAFCRSCARPHSIGPYIQNWTTAADLCHQPDMASYHSFLGSHAKQATAASAREKLVPIFSRQTIPGFNDILFPSPGTYLEPPSAQTISNTATSGSAGSNDTISFNNKKSVLFWRGDLNDTEADPTFWKGLQAQRFVHSINNSTAPITLLLPAPTRLTYKTIPAKEVRALIETDVSFNHPSPCEGICPVQVQEFGCSAVEASATRSEWWENRFLFSTDTRSTTFGEGDAPSFLQMLASNSLPLHASVFRTWYSRRLVPWLHFVPIDLRYQGLWASLAYFTGLGAAQGGVDNVADWQPVTLAGAEVLVPGKPDQAKAMAVAGREWVERTVRREDAEVYMFRLLLEWGRLVDDNRSQCGFVLDTDGQKEQTK